MNDDLIRRGDVKTRICVAECAAPECGCVCNLMEAIDGTPAVNAVKRGKWEEIKNADGGSHDYRCSECRRFRFHNGEMRKKYKYCPNCGAKMEVKEDE